MTTNTEVLHTASAAGHLYADADGTYYLVRVFQVTEHGTVRGYRFLGSRFSKTARDIDPGSLSLI